MCKYHKGLGERFNNAWQGKSEVSISVNLCWRVKETELDRYLFEKRKLLAVVAKAFKPRTGQGRKTQICYRPACSTQQVPGKQNGTLSQKRGRMVHKSELVRKLHLTLKSGPLVMILLHLGRP